MKNNRFKYYRENKSSLHRKVGELLHSSNYLNGYPIYQEYPVKVINSNYPYNHFYDWVILKLNIVIECHGKQHYEPVQFGGITAEGAYLNLQAQRFRDREKRKIAEETGFIYIEIPYTMENELTEEWLLNKISDLEVYRTEALENKENSYQEKLKERRRQYQRETYRRLKELRKKAKNGNSTSQEK